MFCQKCGLKLPDGAKFCGVCGTPVQSKSSPPQNAWSEQNQVGQYGISQPYSVITQPQKKKNGGKVAIITICSLLAVAIICTGIYTVIGGLKKQFSSTPSASNEEPAVNFDLTQYQDHGEISCGLIWVEKTTSSYGQAPETQFAYFDADGNQKSEWFYSSQWTKADFSNGLLCLRESKLYEDNPFITTPRARAKCIVYDTSFSKGIHIECSVNEYYDDGRHAEVAITDADENGNIFAFGEYKDADLFGLYLINESGVKRFDIDKKNLVHDTLRNLEKIKMEKGYFVVDIRADLGVISNVPDYYGIFDEQCNIIFEPSETIPHTVYIVEILSENEFNVHFQGEDHKLYWVKTNSEGEFLEEPHEAD